MAANISIRVLGSLCVGVCEYVGSVNGQVCTYDFGPLTTAMEDLLVSHPTLPGAGMVVWVDGKEVYSQAFGVYTVEEEVRIASASKWLSAVTLMTLIDDGFAQLDDTVETYIPSFAQPGLDQITLRQCFSLTSGLPGDPPCETNPNTTLDVCVDQIATTGLRIGVLPGEDFFYGNASMQTAGRVCEVLTGQSWNDLFQQRVAQPLGMLNTRYDHPVWGSATNPRLARGASSTMPDYARFCQMLLDAGMWQGAEFLSVASVTDVLSSQTNGVPSTYSPYVVGGFGDPRYGLGNWIQPYDFNDPAGEKINTSPGASGFTPWIDQDRQIVAVFMTQTSIILLDDLFVVQRLIRDIVDAPVSCCYADCDSSGTLNIFDYICFGNEYAASTSYADCDGNGSLNIFDYICYGNAYAAGCP